MNRPSSRPRRAHDAGRGFSITIPGLSAALGWEGQTHWSIADLAQYIHAHPDLGLGTPSKSTVGRILQAHDLRLDRL